MNLPNVILQIVAIGSLSTLLFEGLYSRLVFISYFLSLFSNFLFYKDILSHLKKKSDYMLL